jgi:hypothetical protein
MEECEDPTMHPVLLQKSIAKRLANDYHATLDCLSVTEVLGKVREAAIKCSLPYWPEAQALNSRAYGTAIGKETEQGWREAGWKTQVELVGEFWGIPFRGRLDACTVVEGVRHIADDKSVAESNMFFEKNSRVAKPEFSAQVAMYGGMRVVPREEDVEEWDEFCGAFESATSTEGHIWIGAQSRAFDKKSGQYIESWIRKHAVPMSLDEIASLRPAGSGTTVKENATILWKFKQAVKSGVPAIEALKEVPLSCASMYGGACKLYCDANRTCLKLAGVPLASKAIIDVRLPWGEFGLGESGVPSRSKLDIELRAHDLQHNVMNPDDPRNPR